MTKGAAQAEQQTDGPKVEIEFLDPAEIRFERMAYGGLRMRGPGEDVYDHVRVYRTHPLSMPQEYLAIRVGQSELEQQEIGILRRLSDLAAEDQGLIEEELEKRYFIHTVEEIVSIREDMGYFYWVVETDKGTRDFPVPVRPKYISRVGARGRLIRDVDGNRYSIPDLEALDTRSQALFNRHIYW